MDELLKRLKENMIKGRMRIVRDLSKGKDEAKGNIETI